MKKKILVIDDDKELTQEVKEFLQYAGYAVHTINDPLKVEAMVKKNAYDIVLLDLKMPHLSGTSLVKTIKDRVPDCRIFIISGRPFAEKLIEEEGLNNSVTGVISKPFYPEKILEQLAAL
ncbi:MAG: response regulator [Candidatus Omnitrophota bacterium]